MSTLAKINRLLKKMGREERLTRGNGYFYIAESPISGLYMNSLGNDEKSMEIAVDFVNETISAIDGESFKLVV